MESNHNCSDWWFNEKEDYPGADNRGIKLRFECGRINHASNSEPLPTYNTNYVRFLKGHPLDNFKSENFIPWRNAVIAVSLQLYNLAAKII